MSNKTPDLIQVRQFSAMRGRWTDWENTTLAFYQKNKDKPGQIEWRFLSVWPHGYDDGSKHVRDWR